jgi:hypothetical protein
VATVIVDHTKQVEVFVVKQDYRILVMNVIEMVPLEDVERGQHKEQLRELDVVQIVIPVETE